MTAFDILRFAGVILAISQIILHNGGIRRLFIFDWSTGVAFVLMHNAVLLMLIATALMYVGVFQPGVALGLGAYFLVPGWYVCTFLVSLKAVREARKTYEIPFWGVVTDLRYYTSVFPQVQATVGSLVRLVVALFGFAHLMVYYMVSA